LASAIGEYIQISLGPLEVGIEAFLCKNKTADLPVSIFDEEVEEVLAMGETVKFAVSAAFAS